MRLVISLIKYLFLIFVCSGYLGANPAEKIAWKLLPDSNYSIKEVLSSKNHLFSDQDTIHPLHCKKYWAKVIVNHNSSTDYYLSAIPNLNNVWYYSQDGVWHSKSIGRELPTRRRDYFFTSTNHLTSDSVYYVLMDASQLDKVTSFVPTFKIHPKESADHREWYIILFSAVSTIILLLFIINIILEYYVLRETMYIYYLIGLTGGLMYVLSYHAVIDLVIDFRYVKVLDAILKQMFVADFSYIMNRISVMLICYGIIHLTSTFLNTAWTVPRWHQVLHYYLWIFLSTNLFSFLITIMGIYPMDLFFVTISNILLIIAILLVITCGFLSLKKDRKNAKMFLIAHMIPLIFIILTTIYVEINVITAFGHVMMPYLSVLSVPLCLNILLTLRVIHIKDIVHENKLLAKKIDLDNERLKHEKEVEKLEKENIKNQLELEKLTRENLELKVDIQNRQLLTSAMQIQKKDEIISHISQEVSKMSTTEVSATYTGWKAIKSLIQNHDTAESNWENFKIHFEKIHPDFFEGLKLDHPELTSNEIRLSAYLKLNLTNKEIAVLQNIEPSSVKRAKIRLKQKLEK